MNQEELNEVVRLHCLWLNSDKEGKRMCLSGADLSGADLSGEVLRRADFRRADLRWADLSGADLSGADLRWADLSGADLSGVDLRQADLSGADLSGADLCEAGLCEADLRRADLSGADLSGADLSGADIQSALDTVTIVPSEGSFIGWKKCQDDVIIKLKIPDTAKRVNALGRKCRAEFVEVLEVFGADFGISVHDGKTVYKVGEIVRCDKWEENRFVECGGGIHFFITRGEAERY